MRIARVITAVTAALVAVVAVAVPASADTRPNSDAWPDDPNALSFLEWAGLFIGGTALVFVVIWLIAAAVNSKSKHYVPTIPPAGQDQNAVEATHRMPLPAPAEDSTQH
jgi:Na+-transporting methylmalonyl-CoA/oxaloacetate decarboxylase gamma subunit